MIPRLTLIAFAFVAVCVDRGNAQEGVDYFEKKIRPVFIEQCYSCHSTEAKKNNKLKASLILDTPEGLAKGGDSGTLLVPGKPAESLLIKSLKHTEDIKMPPKGKLSDPIVASFEHWIRIGAPAPAIVKSTEPAKEIDWNKAKEFWAFRTPKKTPLPAVRDQTWPLREIDRFILAELEKRDLKPVGPAGKRELLRRVTFDLTGLPPTSEAMDEFASDTSPDAYAKVVDRLLKSPQHGERWARYWLDISRYAEDKALAFVAVRPHAYRYRDWVVKALNDDMPYDKFLKLQLAGDLIDEPGLDPVTKLAGLGFQGLGAEYHKGSVAAQVMADELDDRIDTVTRGLLGLTVACARCHDHKYDPIPTRDYYSLAAAYNGSELVEKPLVEPAAFDRFKAQEKLLRDSEAKHAQWLKDQARDASKPAVQLADQYFIAAWEIRTLQQRKTNVDVAQIAKARSLQVIYLSRLVKLLEQNKLDAKEPAIAAWLNAAKSASETAKVEKNQVVVPDALQKATVELKQAITAALPKTAAKDVPNLLKVLWLNPNSIFSLNPTEAASQYSEATQKELTKQQTDLAKLKKELPPAPPMAHAIQGGGNGLKVNIRGSVERLGEQAPPGFLRIVSTSDSSKQSKTFTRLDLANAIASPGNPLTARVIVNRVWHYHFGKGLVGTPSNFGTLGDRPSHPELLDTLAVRFIENGWSLRWLHREILLSRAYQLSSEPIAVNAERDPENTYLWRYSPRRLDFEAWRDAWLAVAGKLDLTIGGPSIELTQADNSRRTLYSKISRLQPNPLLVLFDFPDANVTSDRRSVTTVPQQQLFTLNSEFTIGTAKVFAKRLQNASPKIEEQIRFAFRLAYGRTPTTEETKASEAFIRDASAEGKDRLTPFEQFAHAILSSNEFQWID